MSPRDIYANHDRKPEGLEKWNQMLAGQPDPEEAEKWRWIAYMLWEQRYIELSRAAREPHKHFWGTTLDYAREYRRGASTTSSSLSGHA
jgi:hypothetical protein